MKRINPFYQPAAESAREGGNRARGSAGEIDGGGHGVGSGVLRNGAGPQSIPSKAKDIFSFKEIDDSEQSRVFHMVWSVFDGFQNLFVEG